MKSRCQAPRAILAATCICLWASVLATYQPCRAAEVVAWGYNYYDQTDVPLGLSNVVAVAGGYGHSLALRADGTVAVWGDNDYGQTNMPAGLSNVMAVAGGDFHSLALRAGGTVAAWGYIGSGQTNVPVGLSNVVAVAGGGGRSLALRADGTVIAWGKYFNGSNWVPLTVPAGLSNVLAVAAGGVHSLALRADGSVATWGSYFDGSGYVPVTLPLALSNAVALAGGGQHSSALVPSPNQVCRSRVVKAGGDYVLTAPLSVGQAARLQWYHDGVFVRSGSALWLTNVQSANLGQYVAVSQFTFGRVTNVVIQLQPAPPRLAAKIQSLGQVALTLYGNVGATYAIESSSALGAGTNWHVIARNILVTNQSQVLILPTGGAPATFYRARVN